MPPATEASMISGILIIIPATVRLALPLMFASFGGLMSERSGVANIALESYLLFSAFAAATIAQATMNPFLGVMGGMLMSGLIGLCFAMVCVFGRGDQIVVGMAFNFLATGLIPILCRALYGVTGGTPSLPASARFETVWGFAGLAVLILIYKLWIFNRTRYGLRVHAAGENPVALTNQGVNVSAVRIRAIVEGSLYAGLGGACLSLALSSSYSRNMAAGRGFIALAALIFGGWRPLPTFLACLIFGFADAIQIHLQGEKVMGLQIPPTFVQLLPYLAALVVIVISRKRVLAPSAINRA